MSLRVQTATPDLARQESVKNWSNLQIPKTVVENGADLGNKKLLDPMEKKIDIREETKDSRRTDVESAVDSINGAMEFVNRGLRFSIHEDTQRIMVKVVNLVTQEVIKEIPPEDALDAAARIREMIGVLLDEWA